MKSILYKIFIAGALLTWVALAAWLVMGDSLERSFKEKQAEMVGAVADRFIAKNSAQADPTSKVKTVAGLHHIEIKVDKFQDNIYRASGVANSFLIETDEGNVLFDTGLGTQAAKHKRLLHAAAPGDVTHIILSHSHSDHIGATKYWKAQFPDARIVTHRRFAEGFRYLRDLEGHFWNRNRLLYTFMPESPPESGSMLSIGNIVADIQVDNYSEYRFTLGGTDFVVLPTPGAEGDDNIVLWLPQQKALFSGDVFGPLFPMVPNMFTLRGEKFRDPIAYIESLETMIALQPEIILPSHFDPLTGKNQLVNDMVLMRDATQYIHDETVKGMNAGKSVWQLMQEIQLPDEINISQGHGKVSWDVRSIWEHYSTWFKFESTTELYPVPIHTLYPEIAEMAGGEQALLALADQKLKAGELEQSLHLIEIALAGTPGHRPALELRLETFNKLMARALDTGSNFSETGWLTGRISATEAALRDD